jgi:hypothetical protein
MVLLMIAMLQAAVSRLVVQPFVHGPPTVALMIPTALATWLLVLVVLCEDWMSHGRPHPVYLWGGLATLGVELIAPLLARSDAGIAFAAGMGRLMN